MNKTYLEQYEMKKCLPRQAISMINNDDIVFTGGDPDALLDALYEDRERFNGLKIYSTFGISRKLGEKIHSAEMTDHIQFTATVLKQTEERAWMRGNVDQVLVSFSEMEDLIERRYRPTVLLTHCAPMDEDGYFSMHTQAGCGSGRSAVNCGAKVLVQVNNTLPSVHTDYYRIHISEVTALCEMNSPSAKLDPDDKEPSEIDKSIAAHIVDHIPNGATIQLGAGAVPSILGRFLEHHKDLGVHTELFVETMTHLMKKGVINNSKKTLLPGISVAGFLGGGSETRAFADKNPAVMIKKLAWVNDPAVISQIDNMISINSCLGVDLRGQVCAESIGLNNTGGLGGQLDFVRGVRKSKGGKSFIVMRSIVEKKDGTKLSKITLTLPAGSVVSTPRSDVMYVVTEYGFADLYYKSAKERAKALIAIAHPDFREELLFEAKKYGYI